MLGSLQGYQQGNPQQQGPPQQQQGPPQGQGGPNPGGIPPPPPLNGQDFTLSSVLHFLQTEWRRYERDRNEWEIERAEMRVRWPPCLLARSERSQRPGAHRAARGRASLVRQRQGRPHAPHQDARICPTHGAVRTPRAHATHPSPLNPFSRSKQLAPGAPSVPPSKLAAIQAQTAGSAAGSQKDDAGSHKDGSGGSSPRSEGTFVLRAYHEVRDS
jgi:striatin 1/3/4